MPPRPPCIKHVSELPDNGGTTWPWTGSSEILGVRTPLSRPLGLVRVGVHHDVLRPGERSSLPHAERWEEECVYVLEGRPTAFVDGERHPLEPDDIAVFAPGTGIEHTIENPTDSEVRLLVIGERVDTAHRACEALIALWNAPDTQRVEKAFAEHATLEDLTSGRSAQGRAAIEALLRERATTLGPGTTAAVGIVPSARQMAVHWEFTPDARDDDPVSGLAMAELHGAEIQRLIDAPGARSARSG